MREYANKLFGEATMKRVREGAIYGVDMEGEFNFTHKPTGHPGVSPYAPFITRRT